MACSAQNNHMAKSQKTSIYTSCLQKCEKYIFPGQKPSLPRFPLHLARFSRVPRLTSLSPVSTPSPMTIDSKTNQHLLKDLAYFSIDHYKQILANMASCNPNPSTQIQTYPSNKPQTLTPQPQSTPPPPSHHI